MTSKAQMALDQAINKLEIEWGYEGIKEEMYEIMKPILKDLEALEIIKKMKLIELVFSDDPYCNLVLSDVDNLIDVDYDSAAPTIEMTENDYEKFREWLANEQRAAN